MNARGNNSLNKYRIGYSSTRIAYLCKAWYKKKKNKCKATIKFRNNHLSNLLYIHIYDTPSDNYTANEEKKCAVVWVHVVSCDLRTRSILIMFQILQTNLLITHHYHMPEKNYYFINIASLSLRIIFTQSLVHLSQASEQSNYIYTVAYSIFFRWRFRPNFWENHPSTLILPPSHPHIHTLIQISFTLPNKHPSPSSNHHHPPFLTTTPTLLWLKPSNLRRPHCSDTQTYEQVRTVWCNIIIT